jgi:hypothetical protein
VTACLLYPKIGRYDDAVRLAKSMSDYTSNELLSLIYTGTKKFEQIRDNIIGRFTNSIGDTYSFAISKYDDGRQVYSEDEMLAIHEKTIAMFKLFFEDGDYLYHAQYPKIAHKAAANIYAKRKDAENTLIHLKECAELAIIFDNYDYNAIHTSLLARGSVSGGVWWSDTSNQSFDLLSALSDALFDFIRSDLRFTAIETKLKKYAKK